MCAVWVVLCSLAYLTCPFGSKQYQYPARCVKLLLLRIDQSGHCAFIELLIVCVKALLVFVVSEGGT